MMEFEENNDFETFPIKSIGNYNISIIGEVKITKPYMKLLKNGNADFSLGLLCDLDGNKELSEIILTSLPRYKNKHTFDRLMTIKEWLKNRMNNIENGDDFLNYTEKDDQVGLYFNKEQIEDWIDEAFKWED